MRTQVVQAPGNKVIQQPIIQNYVRETEVHHHTKPVIRKVPVIKRVAIPTPIIKRVPVIKKVPIPIKRKEPCCGGTTVNKTHIHIHQEKPRKVYKKGPIIEYKRNYERVIDNDGFHHPENTDRRFNPDIVGGDQATAELFL